MNVLSRWKDKARALRNETFALVRAAKHPRTPWYAKALALCVVAYALSPIDLIPDPIPVLGQLDDLVLIPLGIALIRWLIPRDVLAECRARADKSLTALSPRARRLATLSIIVIWILLIVFAGTLIWRAVTK